MQNRFGLLVTDIIHMIMPGYSHNYALFYQLLDSNLFTHRYTYAILREATSETYCWGTLQKTKIFYGFTKIHLGVHLATSDWIASTYLCRSRAEAFKERG